MHQVSIPGASFTKSDSLVSIYFLHNFFFFFGSKHKQAICGSNMNNIKQGVSKITFHVLDISMFIDAKLM